MFVNKQLVYVITPFGVVLLVYSPTPRGRVAPEGGGRINRNTTTKGVIKCLLPLIGRCLETPARAKMARHLHYI